MKTTDTSKGAISSKRYEKELRKLQARLCELQAWVKHKGLRASALPRIDPPLLT